MIHLTPSDDYMYGMILSVNSLLNFQTLYNNGVRSPKLNKQLFDLSNKIFGSKEFTTRERNEEKKCINFMFETIISYLLGEFFFLSKINSNDYL